MLITHLQSGNSYGIPLKEKHCKFPSPSSARGSRARARSATTGSRRARGLGAARSIDGALRRLTSSSGAGVHGLSTAWHLAQRGEEVLVVDKTGVGAGASGIACGVVRNNYFQPAMSELMAACVEIWESDPETLHYHGSGYIALGDGAQEADLTTVHERQQRIGYPSELILGEAEVAAHMRALFPDWRAPGPERLPARAPRAASRSTASRCSASPPRRARPAPRSRRASRSPASSSTAPARSRACRPRPGRSRSSRSWSPSAPGSRACGRCSACPRRLEVAGEEREMWTYWYLQEGEIDVDPNMFVTADGALPPVLHVDSHAPLHADDGRLITDEQWGVYFKQDRDSVQGGASPLPKGHDFEVDPYPTGTVEPGFPDLWCAALSHCMERFEGRAAATARCARAAWAPSPPTTSRSSTTCAPTCSWPPTPTTATR